MCPHYTEELRLSILIPVYNERTVVERRLAQVQHMYQLNKIGTPAWWLYGRVLRRGRIGKVMLKIFDKTVWFGSKKV